MFKKFLMMVILCISLLTLLGTNANAYPAIIGGWGAWPGSVCVWTEWKQVANYDVTPTDVTVTLYIDKVLVHYQNPGGQPGGIGVPFYVDVTATLEGEPLSDPITKNGKYMMEICFDEEYLKSFIGPDIGDPPNPGWTMLDITVVEMYVLIEGFSEMDDDNEVNDRTAVIGGPCTLDNYGTAYDCETEQECGWYKKTPDTFCEITAPY